MKELEEQRRLFQALQAKKKESDLENQVRTCSQVPYIFHTLKKKHKSDHLVFSSIDPSTKQIATCAFTTARFSSVFSNVLLYCSHPVCFSKQATE